MNRPRKTRLIGHSGCRLAPHIPWHHGTNSIKKKKKQQIGRRGPLRTFEEDLHKRTKKSSFYAFWKKPIFANFSGFLKALYHKGFTRSLVLTKTRPSNCRQKRAKKKNFLRIRPTGPRLLDIKLFRFIQQSRWYL